MGWHYHTIIDAHATAESAEPLSQRVLNWMAEEQIVERQKTDCLYSKDGGHAPGPRFREAIEPIRDEHLAGFIGGRINGLEIVTKRTVFHAGEGPIELLCGACARRYEAPSSWSDAVSQWYDGDDNAALACSFCDHVQPVTRWKHIPTYGFGYLGFGFHNWPDLKQSFIEQVAERLGHPVVLVTGHM